MAVKLSEQEIQTVIMMRMGHTISELQAMLDERVNQKEQVKGLEEKIQELFRLLEKSQQTIDQSEVQKTALEEKVKSMASENQALKDELFKANALVKDARERAIVLQEQVIMMKEHARLPSAAADPVKEEAKGHQAHAEKKVEETHASVLKDVSKKKH
jgi:predicted nuclease with TOPRIM domain